MKMHLFVMIFLIVMPLAYSRQYCIDNDTLAMEKDETAILDSREMNITKISVHKCRCLDDSCRFQSLTVFDILLFAIPFALSLSGNRIFSIIGCMGLLLFSAYTLGNDIAYIMNGMPVISLDFNLVRVMSLFILGYSLVMIFYNIQRG